MDQQPDRARLIELAAEIVQAYVARNRIQPIDLTRLIGEVHGALARAEAGETAPAKQPKITPQQVRKSITPDHLVSFEDGKRYKTLRRHLAQRGLTPQVYREKWGLASDYPMVAPNYAKQRSELARALGLGQQRRRGQASSAEAPGADAPGVAADSAADDAANGDAPEPAALEPATGKPKRGRAPRANARAEEQAPGDGAA